MDLEEFLSPHPDVRIRNAIGSGDLQKVKDLIALYKDCPEVLVNKEDGRTPLCLALVKRRKQIFDYLIDETVFGTWQWINHIEKKYGRTVLIAAVDRFAYLETDIEFVKKLLLHGADSNIRDKREHATALTYTTFYGENECLLWTQLLIKSGATLNPPCSFSEKHRSGCLDVLYDNALNNEYYHIADFLDEEEIMDLTLIQRYEQELDENIRQNLYVRAIFYEDYDILWGIMELVKQRKKSVSMQDVENDVIKKLLKSEYFDRFNEILEQGFLCKQEDIKGMEYLIQKKPDPNKRMELAYHFYRALSGNTLVKNLKSVAYKENFSDVVCMCSSEVPLVASKKRALIHVLSGVKQAKK